MCRTSCQWCGVVPGTILAPVLKGKEDRTGGEPGSDFHSDTPNSSDGVIDVHKYNANGATTTQASTITNRSRHPRVRLHEEELDEQVPGLFAPLKIQDEKLRDRFGRVLRARTRDDQEATQVRIAELDHRITLICKL
jgi:hypothetical protein